MPHQSHLPYNPILYLIVFTLSSFFLSHKSVQRITLLAHTFYRSANVLLPVIHTVHIQPPTLCNIIVSINESCGSKHSFHPFTKAYTSSGIEQAVSCSICGFRLAYHKTKILNGFDKFYSNCLSRTIAILNMPHYNHNLRRL